MMLTVDRIDLKPEHKTIPCSKVELSHFQEDVQKAIVAAGQAMFWEFDRTNYNAIYPPK